MKQLYFILLHLSCQFTRTFSYPYKLPPPSCGSIHLAIFPVEFSKFLSREKLYEASASLVDPNGMKLFEHLHISKSLGHAHFHLIPCTYVSATSSFPNLAIMALSTATTFYFALLPMILFPAYSPPCKTLKSRRVDPLEYFWFMQL